MGKGKTSGEKYPRVVRQWFHWGRLKWCLERELWHSVQCPGSPGGQLREDTGHIGFISWGLWIVLVVHLSPGCQQFQSMAECSLTWDCRPLKDDGRSSKISQRLDRVGAGQSSCRSNTLGWSRLSSMVLSHVTLKEILTFFKADSEYDFIIYLKYSLSRLQLYIFPLYFILGQ